MGERDRWAVLILASKATMFLPGEHLLGAMASTVAGLWFVTPDNCNYPAVVVKLETPILKFVYRGSPLYLLVAKVRTAEGFVKIVGLRVDDDPEHPKFVFEPLIEDGFNMTANLETIMRIGEARIHFFDDRNRPVMSGNYFVDKPQAAQVTCLGNYDQVK